MKKVHLLILLIVSFTLQSCFELIEQVQLKKDGSGNFQLTLNMSKSKTKLNSIMKLEKINGRPVPKKWEITARLKEIEKLLSKTEGITNAKTSMDFDNYIMTVSCNFSNITQLNKAIKTIKQKENLTGDALTDNYAYDAKTNTFQRKNKFGLKDIYSKMSSADREIFSSANYTSIYKFDVDVKTVSNKGAKISPSKKAVMLKETALNVVTEKKSIENKINLTNE
ncbi:hypothetical protein ACQ33O_00755 [Ferruginibacter sp. SUN002]|uniref:hypothetical protein n=1 Tax=Ferruginibacter sp. SUN002 TaxID=2937789 RepID=UPI003D35EBFC